MSKAATKKTTAKKKPASKAEKAIKRGNKIAKEVKKTLDEKLTRGRGKALYRLGPIFENCKTKADHLAVLSSLSYREGHQPYNLILSLIDERKEPRTMAYIEQVTRERYGLKGHDKETKKTVQNLGTVAGFYVSQFKELGVIEDTGERVKKELKAS